MTLMAMSYSRLLLSVALLTSWYDVTMGACPWTRSDLLPWSNSSIWPNSTVPELEAEVSITGHVLLDIQPPSLKTITVQPGASLVWGDVDDIFLNVSYIYVLGSFHIGSETCRFTKKATINLYGRTNSNYFVEGIGRKFVAAGPNGTLEIHGQEKMSWTKLAHTIPSARSLQSCAVLYDHQSTLLGQDQTQGLHIVAWSADGRLLDFKIFVTADYGSVPDFINTLSDGVIIAAAVRTNIGTKKEAMMKTFEDLGSKLIRSVKWNQQYAFIARKGDKNSTQEKQGTEDYVGLFEDTYDLVFRARSEDSKRVNFQVVDGEVAHPRVFLVKSASTWNVGDEILFPSTDFDWRQAEVKRMVKCTDCAENEIRLYL